MRPGRVMASGLGSPTVLTRSFSVPSLQTGTSAAAVCFYSPEITYIL
jgi:hypothetical protein